MGLITYETQPDFPHKDISEPTAEMLEFMLQNRAIIKEAHAGAKTYYLYDLGHEALARTANAQLGHDQRLGAFSFGITALEAISAIVRPIHPTDLDRDAVTLQVTSASFDLQQSFGLKISDARDKLRAELPRTYRVIGAAAARFYPEYEHYAQGGAGVARELELDTASD